ncbi:hypothetical protein R50073_19290 [Maricurvus nonylphenolicus]|uniref:zinc-binding dehydrogenase n=1 Tax=Maricurvus nonylphenolicus TaxID=1008307 RepID=UPI0036F244C4
MSEAMMNKTMKAVVCEKSGPDGYAQFRDFPRPEKAVGHEVLIDTKNMSLNFPDPLQIQGLYQFQPPVPFVLGMEFSGIVRDVGDKVTRFKVGDRVVSLGMGAFAEQNKAEEQYCFALPDDISFEQGCLAPLAAGTALYGLKYRGSLVAGETVAVTGAAGGTGLAAVQLAKALGATVIAICSSKEKCDLASRVGADHALNYTELDISEEVKSLTGGKGVDVVYDTVGGELFDKLSRRMA